jgi:hypothetical protein
MLETAGEPLPPPGHFLAGGRGLLPREAALGTAAVARPRGGMPRWSLSLPRALTGGRRRGGGGWVPLPGDAAIVAPLAGQVRRRTHHLPPPKP